MAGAKDALQKSCIKWRQCSRRTKALLVEGGSWVGAHIVVVGSDAGQGLNRLGIAAFNVY